MLTFFLATVVNEVLGDHNVDKQMSDSRGDVAYLMADISDVDTQEIKEIFKALESLSCAFNPHKKARGSQVNGLTDTIARIRTRVLY